MNRLKVPWSELAALLAGYIALVAWDAHPGRAAALSALTTFALAVASALVPKRALSGPAPAAAEAASITGALGSLAIATTVVGPTPPTHLLGIVRAVLLGEIVAVGMLVALALPLGTATMRRAALPSLAAGALATAGYWPQGHSAWRILGAEVLGPLATAVLALTSLHAVRRPLAPIDRARLIAPALGANVLAATAATTSLLGERGSPVPMAVGVVALVVGLTLGTGAIALEHAARFARRAIATLAGLVVGSAVAVFLPELPLLGVITGVAVLWLAVPWVEESLRPDGGALLQAADEIEHALPGTENPLDLAAAALDPLRIAARDLRAPAALWVLDHEETLRVDVAGAATASRLSMEGERAILSWLRARHGVLFADTLRPLVVRRAELRPVLSALEAHDALGALALTDGEELIGVLLLPRGNRTDVPTYEEEVRLLALGRAMSGTLSTVNALRRAHERTLTAQRAQEIAESQAKVATDEIARRDALGVSLTAQRAIGSLEDEWVGYSPAMRALGETIEWHLGGGDPVTLVCEAGAGAVAVARAIHTRGERRRGVFQAADAASVHPRDSVAALVGDGRGAQVIPGWLELSTGGTLLIEDVMAMGFDAQIALLDALRTGSARRLGAEATYKVDVRLVVTVRRPLRELDLPRELLERLGTHVLKLPALRARAEDLESLVLIGIDRACRVAGRSVVGVSPEALTAMRAYNWPGNLRELFDVLEQSVARCRGAKLALEDLPAHLRALVSVGSSDRGLRDDDDDRDEAYEGDA